MEEKPLPGRLPHLARVKLMRASEVDPFSPMGESDLRRAAVDEAIEIVKQSYPEFFVTE